MKILITTDTYTPVVNGVVFSTLLLKQELERLGHEVKVVTLSTDFHSRREENVYYIASFSVDEIYPEARVAIPKMHRLTEELLEWKPDIIHSQQEFSTFDLAWHLSEKGNIPIVHTYHTAYEDYTHYFFPSVRLGKRLVAFLSRELSGVVSCLIAPTEKIKAMLESYGVRCPIEVIPTGVDLKQFEGNCDPEWRRETRLGLGIPEDHQVLVYLGRLAKEKGVDRLMDMLAGSGREDFTLLVVGDGPFREKLRKKASEQSYPVVFAGAVPHQQIRDYYQLGDLFVTASTSETQGLTYLESLACGVPVLCQQDECVDGVIEDGINGWQYQDESRFQSCLDTFFDEEGIRQRLSDNARATALRFSAEAFGEAVEDLYKRMIDLPENAK